MWVPCLGARLRLVLLASLIQFTVAACDDDSVAACSWAPALEREGAMPLAWEDSGGGANAVSEEAAAERCGGPRSRSLLQAGSVMQRPGANGAADVADAAGVVTAAGKRGSAGAPVAQVPVAQAPVVQAAVAQAPNVEQAKVAQAKVAQVKVAQAKVSHVKVAQAEAALAPVVMQAPVVAQAPVMPHAAMAQPRIVAPVPAEGQPPVVSQEPVVVQAAVVGQEPVVQAAVAQAPVAQAPAVVQAAFPAASMLERLRETGRRFSLDIESRSQAAGTFFLLVFAILVMVGIAFIVIRQIRSDVSGDLRSRQTASRRDQRQGGPEQRGARGYPDKASMASSFQQLPSARQLPPSARGPPASGAHPANGPPGPAQTTAAPGRSGLSRGNSPPRTAPEPAPAAPTPPRENGAPTVVARHLCPGLVVPRGNECLLAVPTLAAVGMPLRDHAGFDVKDLHGKPVIHCEVARPDWTVGGRRPIVVLRAAAVPEGAPRGSSSALLAYCKAGRESGMRRSTYIYDARDELFAHITKDPDSPAYVLTSGHIGLHLVFDGNFDEHAVNVTNESREQLADTEPCQMNFDPSGNYVKLRVVSNVDVGIMLCGLLAIDHMEQR